MQHLLVLLEKVNNNNNNKSAENTLAKGLKVWLAATNFETLGCGSNTVNPHAK